MEAAKSSSVRPENYPAVECSTTLAEEIAEEIQAEETQAEAMEAAAPEEGDDKAEGDQGHAKSTSNRCWKYKLLEEEEILAMELVSQRPPLWDRKSKLP